MQTNITRHTIRVTLLAAFLLPTGLLARPTNAQTGIHGKFTLASETRWGQAVLPAGDYELRFVNDNVGPILAIRDAKALRGVAYERVDVQEDSANGASALLISTRGAQHVVCSLTIAELGKTFIYERPPARGRAEEEARETQTIPILVAKK